MATPSSSADSRVPRLASASSASSVGGRGGVPHALWRPQMQTFLIRQGIQERDYTAEIPRWKELTAAVAQDEAADEHAGFDAMLGALGAASSPVVKKETLSPEMQKAKKAAAEAIARSRKAYALLYEALPADLRALVAEVPQGYAYGIWTLLEKKFRNTEPDSVLDLYRRFTKMAQASDEAFDAYKARVDAACELLRAAKQTPPDALYASVLLDLQPHYATAVLTLKTGDRLKDESKIDWPAITEYMSQYERSEQFLRMVDGNANRTLATRGKLSGPATADGIKKKSIKASGAGNGNGDSAGVRCYNCDQLGHYASDCPLPDRRKKRGSHPKESHARKGGRKREDPRSGRDSGSGSDESAEEGKPHRSRPPAGRANMSRQNDRANPFDPLSGEDSDDAAEEPRTPAARRTERSDPGRSYLARVLAGLPGKTTVTGNVAHATRDQRDRADDAPTRESDADTALDEELRTTAHAVDSAATVPTICDKKALTNVRQCSPLPIKMANGEIVSAKYVGDLRLRLPVYKENRHVTVTIRNVYYHEKFDANLLSWDLMKEDGWRMKSCKRATYLTTPGGRRIRASTRGRLTILDHAPPRPARVMAAVSRSVCRTASDLVRWHERLGHVSWDRLRRMCRMRLTGGMSDIGDMSAAELNRAKEAIINCQACAQGKQQRNALGHSGLEKGSKAGEVLHMDTFYATYRDPQTTKKVHEYCLLATDGYTEWRWASTTRSKADVQQEAIDILRNCSTLTGRQPRLVICDMGSEFENRTLEHFCSERGIKLQPAPPRAKELNGVAEKSVDTVKNHTRAMLLGAGIPDQVGWRRAACHHVQLWNRTHIGRRTGVTPYEAMTGRTPSIKHFGVFGCDVMVHQDRTQRDTTFSPKAEPAIYLGHSHRYNAPVVRMLHTGQTMCAKDVHFREGTFTHARILSGGQEQDSHSTAPRADEPWRPSSLPSIREESKDDADALGSDAEGDPDEDREARAGTSQYSVKAIHDARTVHGKKEYLVKWIGHATPTWEPEETITTDAPDAVKEYEAFLDRRSQARVTRSRAATATPATQSSDSESDEEKHDPVQSDTLAARDGAAQRL